MTKETLIPGGLLANDFPVQTDAVIVESGQVLELGAVVGIDATNKVKLSLSAASDGSEVPVGVMPMDVDASAGDTNASMYLSAALDQSKLIFGAGHTVDTVKAAFRGSPLFLKNLS